MVRHQHAVALDSGHHEPAADDYDTTIGKGWRRERNHPLGTIGALALAVREIVCRSQLMNRAVSQLYDCLIDVENHEGVRLRQYPGCRAGEVGWQRPASLGGGWQRNAGAWLDADLNAVSTTIYASARRHGVGIKR